MKQARWIVVLLAALLWAGCEKTATTQPNKEKPLRLDDTEALALLGGDSNIKAEHVAINERCLVCHGNFRDEELSVIHAKHEVGCERCHGPSDAHCGDENNVTPPEVMYPRDAIAKACTGCHKAEKLAEKEHHWDVFAPKEGKPKKVCTECHGKHRMAVRTVRWNKKTRQLIKGGWMEAAEKKKKAAEGGT